MKPDPASISQMKAHLASVLETYAASQPPVDQDVFCETFVFGDKDSGMTRAEFLRNYDYSGRLEELQIVRICGESTSDGSGVVAIYFVACDSVTALTHQFVWFGEYRGAKLVSIEYVYSQGW